MRIALGAIGLALVGCTSTSPSNLESTIPSEETSPIPAMMEQKMEGEMEKSNDTAMEQSTGEVMEKMEKDDDSMMEKDEEAMMKKAAYMTYAQDVLMNGETKLLFFHASWCPACKKANSDLEALYGSDEAPMKNTYKVDYDTSADLKAKYGVTSQHTFVLVDGQGNEIKKMTGHTVESLKAMLK